MNRFSIIRVIIAILFVSCSEGIVEIKEEQPSDIRFSTLLPKASSINSTSSLAQKGGFNVWAYSHSGSWDPIITRTPLLDNTTVTSTDGVTWGYESPVPWPESENVSFFAYGPAGSATIVDNAQEATGAPVIQFTVNDSPALQTDLLISSAITNQTGANYGYNNAVNINFYHALSQIKFSALLSGEFDKEVKITQIVFRNIYNEGETVLQTPVEWEVNTSSTKNYTLTTANGLSTNALSSVPQEISNANGMLFMLPQTIERINNVPEMEVTLTVGGVAVSYTVPIFSTAAWLPGRTYNYQLIVFRDSLQVIMTDSETTLTDWNLSIMIQPVPLSTNQYLNTVRIHTALFSLANLNTGGVDNLNVDSCKYFALYLRNNVTDDITIDMKNYNQYFTKGKYMMFDAKKIIDKWNKGEDGKNYTLKVINYEDYWTLGKAAQPTGADVDGTTYATTNTEKNPAEPRDYIRNKGSIILIRNDVPVPIAEEETGGSEETGGGETGGE